MKRKWSRFLALFLLTFYSIALLTPISMIYAEPPQINAPEINPPEINPPEVKPPDVNTPDVNEPEVDPPDENEPNKENTEGKQEGNDDGKGNNDDGGFLPSYWNGLKYTGQTLISDYYKWKDQARVDWNNGYVLDGKGRTELEGERSRSFKRDYLLKGVFRTGFGMALPTHGEEKRPSMWKTALDIWQLRDKYNDVMGLYDQYKKYKSSIEAAKLTKKGANVGFTAAKTLGEGKLLAKANPLFSAIGVGVSGVETVNNIMKGDGWGTLQSSGDMLMSAAPLIGLAGPAAAPVALGVGAVGGGMWLVGTGAKNWDAVKHVGKKLVTDPVGLGKEAVKDLGSAAKKVGDTAKSAVNTVKGWFS